MSPFESTILAGCFRTSFRRLFQLLCPAVLWSACQLPAATALNPAVSQALSSLARQIGPGVSNLGFKIQLDDGKTVLGSGDFAFAVGQRPEGGVSLRGHSGDTEAVWDFGLTNNGVMVRLSVSRPRPLRCKSMENLVLDFSPPSTRLGPWRLLGSRGEAGMPSFSELGRSDGRANAAGDGAESFADDPQAMQFEILTGIFPDSKAPGLFIGTRLPQHFAHRISARSLSADAVRFTCTTRFIEGPSRGQQLSSEAVWVCGARPAREAINAYASFYPELSPAPLTPAGWNSWDYYYNTVTLDDVTENLEALRRDPVLSSVSRYIVVDDGWQTSWGDWYPNHRFPGGLEKLAAEIKARGYVPGIWTAPLVVHFLTTPGLRHPEMLAKNEYGDPYAKQSDSTTSKSFVLDPSHPQGQAFIRELYTRLYRAGFRYFKIDYINEVAEVPRLYDPTKGPYDAIRLFLQLVRESVGPESFILGCDLPPEAGPGLVDGMRLGIDIHNQWTHIEWAFDSIMAFYWMHNRFWVNDPDFLIVRGPDTSAEKVNNVTNPNAHSPNPPRWRRGPEFSYEEARTWASMVMLTGGSAMMSDRLSTLNEKGLDLLRKSIQPTGARPEPLDLCDHARPSVWLQRMATEQRVTVINWSEQAVSRKIHLPDYGLKTPPQLKEYWTGKSLKCEAGTVVLELPAHGTEVLTWPSP